MPAPANGLSFDISDDNQFKTYVVQQFTSLSARMDVFDKTASIAAKVPVIEQEVFDLREKVKTQESRQWMHSTAVFVLATLKNVLTHGKF